MTKTAAHETFDVSMAEARIRFELAFERLSATAGPMKASIDWGHAGSAVWLLGLTKQMCEHVGVDEADVVEGYGE